MPVATQKTGEAEINQLNLAMRQTPWYQQFFAQRGLDPNRVKLNEQQRAQLAELAARNGYQLGDRMKIDEAGNINQMGGFAGMPTWAKIAIAAAPAAATAGFGMAGMGPMAFLGSSAPATTAGATLPTLASTPIGTGLGVMPSLTGVATVGGTAGTTAGGSLLANGVKKAGGSLLDHFLGGESTQNLADAGQMMGNIAESEAANRLNNAELTNRQGYLSLQAQQDRRAQESDAMKKIQQAGYIKSGGVPYDASKIQLSGGRTLPQFNFPRAPITDEAKQAAGMLEKTMLERLGPNGSYAPPPIEQFTNRGALERATNYGSMASSVLGAANKFGVLDDIGRGVRDVGSWIGKIF